MKHQNLPKWFWVPTLGQNWLEYHKVELILSSHLVLLCRNSPKYADTQSQLAQLSWIPWIASWDNLKASEGLSFSSMTMN